MQSSTIERLHRTPDIDLELSTHCEHLRGRYKTIGLILDVAYIEGALGFDVPHAVRRTTAWQNVGAFTRGLRAPGHPHRRSQDHRVPPP
ncbi:hypothetical protein GCM10023323_16710 [Streptomyces thinghirensis]|uniref:Uncharacterized protein n=1 Tax=Streptomyces thinghirensis TaxID=551547 RepID=A0ABP9T211_9ACTN